MELVPKEKLVITTEKPILSPSKMKTWKKFVSCRF